MKCIGLIGGMSWESSAQHYVIVNRAVRDRLGGSHSARSLMLSVDFAELEELAHAGEWDRRWATTWSRLHRRSNGAGRIS
jgi:aspartate racemase